MCADDGNERDGFITRLEWMVLRGEIVLFKHQHTENKSPKPNDEEHMPAVVNNDREREDVSTTASDGGVGRGGMRKCARRGPRR